VVTFAAPSTDGKCICGADPRAGSAFCGTDCEPDFIADPDDPWGFVQRQAAVELTRMAETDRLDPWLATS
jgi:hypothetical protein